MEDSVKKDICEIVHDVRFDEKMSDHTSFRVGGPAEVFVSPERSEVSRLLKYLYENGIKYVVLGNGSNVLVSDKGLDGIVIDIGKNMSGIFSSEESYNHADFIVSTDALTATLMIAEAGALLSQVAAKALKSSFSGFEALSGIPGSVGGAIFMNAGAYGSEINDSILSVDVVKSTGKVVTYPKERLHLSYRHSRFMDVKDISTPDIILSATFSFERGNEEEIKNKMLDFSMKRREKQPLEFPSAGSTFKRPEGYFAGKLISDAGLKGLSIGGAEVSTKHAGFIINKDNATAKDIYSLIKEVQKRVLDRKSVV